MRALLTKENPAGGHDPPSSHQMSQQLGCVSIRWLEQTNRDLKGKTCQELTAADFPGTRKMAVSCICFLKTTYVAQPITNGCAVVRNRCFVASTTVPQFRLDIVESWPTVFCTDMNFHHQVSDCYCCRYFVGIMESWPTTGVRLIEKISTLIALATNRH